MDEYLKRYTVDNNVSLALMVVNCYLPFSFVDNQYFRQFLRDTRTRMSPMSRRTMTERYIPRIRALVHEFILTRLRDHHACLIVDGMTKNNKCFYNLLLSVIASSPNEESTEVFFWDCKEMESQSAESIGTLIGNTIKELEQERVTVGSYASDNCPAMISAMKVATIVACKPLTRIPCGSHILNLLFKDLMEEEPIARVWNTVLLLYWL